MQVAVPEAKIARATVAQIDVGRLSLGQISIGRLIASNATMGIKSGRAFLQDVHVTVSLHFLLNWGIFVPMPWPFDDIEITNQTTDLGTFSVPFGMGDVDIPGLQDINLLIPSITAGALSASADPIDGLTLQGVQVEEVSVTNIALPTAGFSVPGLGLNNIELDLLDVPAAHIGGATVGHMHGNPVLLPVLRLHNIGLPNAGVSDIISGVIDIPVRPANDITTPGLDLGILKVNLTIKPTAQTRIAQMHMSGVNASATVGTAELQNVVVPFDITNLTLADLGLEIIDVPLIGVS